MEGSWTHHAHPLALPLAAPPLFRLFSFLHPWHSSEASALSPLGLHACCFCQEDHSPRAPHPQLLYAGISLTLPNLSLDVPSSRRSSLPSTSAQRLFSYVHLRVLSPPTTALNTRDPTVYLFASPIGLQTPQGQGWPGTEPGPWELPNQGLLKE